ncbi:MAG: glycosyltransferase family 2 protein [Candidatus Marinimicrobia bacterium]|nr:glycosyltransferase family 2 protein [Candidatus Neomarinimicrobiota bacterium]
MIDISIIIVNYNVKEYIIDCIQSIKMWTPETISYEIIVIDNKSEDGSAVALTSKFPEITIVKNKKNMGFSRAINQGAEMASGSHLFFLNPDTLLIEDSLSILYSFLNQHNNVCIVGPKLINKKGDSQQSFWKFPTLLTTVLEIYHLDFLNKYKNYIFRNKSKYIYADSVSGGAFFLKKSLFIELKGFNDNLFWMEDVDFCKRASTLGYKVCYLSQTKLIHYIGKSSEKNWVVTISNRLLSKIKYFKIHQGWMDVFLLVLSIYLLVILKSIFFIFLSPFGSIYRKKLSGYLVSLKMLITRQY